MTTQEKIQKVIGNLEPSAYILRMEDPAGLESRLDGKVNGGHDAALEAQLRSFRELFDTCVISLTERLGKPQYIETKHSSQSPNWAPMGLYSDWKLDDGNILCLFMGGDGNPEDPLILIVGKTTAAVKSSRDDPWKWQWKE